MKEENKKSKKKVLLYYLILAACLLVIAAITVTLVLTVGRKKPNDIIENPPINNPEPDDTGDKNQDENKPNTPDNPSKPDETDKPDDNQPTIADGKFGLPMTSSTVTCGYEFAYDATLDRYCVHQGMDFEGAAGDEVCAVMSGTVTEIVRAHIIGENYVKIAHDNGMTSLYKYIDADSELNVGDIVGKGEVIGTIAEANGMEMKQGEHLHFELSVNGKTADPNTYLEILEK